MGGVYSRNKYFDTFYLAGTQELTELEEEVYVEDATTTTVFESFDDYLMEDWADFIRDFCCE